VTLGSTVDFVSQGTPGTLQLPGTSVVGEHIIGLAAASLIVRPAEAAAYVVTVRNRNPTSSSVTYSLAVQGMPSSWVTFAPTMTLGPRGTADVPMELTAEPFASLAESGFTGTATAGGATDASDRVTLAPGASQVVAIATGAVDFAVPGSLDLPALTIEAPLRQANTGLGLDPTTFGLA
jgi:hypothetical protein